MVRIDERHEAIAFIRMTIDNAQNASLRNNCDLNVDLDVDPDNIEYQEFAAADGPVTEHTWKFGSPEGRRTTSHILEANLAPLDHNYDSFDQRLRAFIANSLPEDALRYEDEIYVSIFHSLQVKFRWLIWTDPSF